MELAVSVLALVLVLVLVAPVLFDIPRCACCGARFYPPAKGVFLCGFCAVSAVWENEALRVENYQSSVI